MANRVLDKFTAGLIDTILSGAGCTTGGTYQVFYGKYSDVDWAATETATDFNTTTSELEGLVMVATKTLYNIKFDIENANVASVLQNGVYYQTDINLTVLGRNKDVQGTIHNMKNLCGDLFAIVLGCDKYGQLVGVQRNLANDGFEKVYDPLVLAEHTGTTGTSSEKSRNELVLRCKSEYEPLGVTMTVAELTALL